MADQKTDLVREGVKMKTPAGRLRFNNLVDGRERKHKEKDGTETSFVSYDTAFLFDSKEDMQPLREAAARVAEAKFGANWKSYVQNNQIRWPFKDGGVIPIGRDEPIFGQGIFYFNASSHNPIEIVSRYKDPKTGKPKLLVSRTGENRRMTPDVDELVYEGVYARLSVTIKAYDKDGGKGVTIYVNAAQTLEYGERIAVNNVSAVDEFEDDAEDMPEGEMGDTSPAGDATDNDADDTDII